MGVLACWRVEGLGFRRVYVSFRVVGCGLFEGFKALEGLEFRVEGALGVCGCGL